MTARRRFLRWPSWFAVWAGYEIRDRDYRVVPAQTPSRETLRAAMHEMARFY